MELIYLIMFFGWFSLMVNTSGRSGFPRYNNPLPPPYPKKKNRSVPKMRNPPPPPIKEGVCYLDCGNTKPFPSGNGSICLNCRSSIVKDEELEFIRPEFPKDRIK